MSLFFVVEDDTYQRTEWCKLLEKKGHSTTQATDVVSGIELFLKMQSRFDDDPDLILLDHHLGDDCGMDIIDYLLKRKTFSKEYFRDRIILITGSHNLLLGPEYTRRGAVSTLVKPVSEPQFWMTIESALEHRRLFFDQLTDWEQAVKILEDKGLLKPLENVQEIQDSYNALKETYEKLLEDIQSASGDKQFIAQAYTRAYEALNLSLGDDIGNIPSFLQDFEYTDKFIEDIQDVYYKDKLYYFIFRSYLSRIANDPRSLRSRDLKGEADGFYEYRIGQEYRLYFSYADTGIKFHRLTRKTKQDKTLVSLCRSA